MPNEYVNKVELADGTTLIDITDTSAEENDVKAGEIFYKSNGARSIGTYTDVQADWLQASTASAAYILNKPAIPTKTSDLTNDSGFISTETDPTVPSWAKASTKPSYTAQEVGALPSNTPIPSATSDLINDSDFITSSDLVQSDWEEDDSTDLAYVQNRPAIRAGDGQNSIIEGQIEADSNAAEYTLYFSGSGSTLSYTTNDTLPSANNIIYNSVLYDVPDAVYLSVIAIDTSNNTITIDRSYTGTITNREVKLLYRYHKANGQYSHAEGNITVTASSSAHAEGTATQALGIYAHAEGWSTKALNLGTHAEGYRTIAKAVYSHAEGASTQALGKYSHSEGYYTIANGQGSHASGYYTTANNKSQHTFGEYNVLDTAGTTSTRGSYVEIVGNGTGDNARSNAYTLDWNGNGWYAGKLTVGSGPTNNMDVATKQYVDTATSGMTTTLAGLTDTTISSPTNGQMLRYNSTSGKWENVAPVTYTLSLSNNVITLTGSDGSTSSITLPVYNGTVTVGGGS